MRELKPKTKPGTPPPQPGVEEPKSK